MRHARLFTSKDQIHVRTLKNPRATKALIFLHGLGATSSFWKPIYKKLRTNHSLYFIDLLGFGHSDKPRVFYTLEDHVKAIHDYLQEDVSEQEISLIAHSASSSIALSYLEAHPTSIDQIFLLAPMHYTSQDEQRAHISQSDALSTVLDDTWTSRFACVTSHVAKPLFIAGATGCFPDYPTQVAQDFFLHTPRSYFGTLHNAVRPELHRKLLAKVSTIPGLEEKITIIHGMKDETVPYENSEQLSKEFGIPLIPVPNQGHEFPLFKAEFTMQLLKHLLRV